jgi:hypothetical protein
MSKRLQVLLEEPELREIRRTARAQKMTVAGWVRLALREARRRQPARDSTKKLEVVRSAVRHNYPTGDIDQMLEDVERGYLNEKPS